MNADIPFHLHGEDGARYSVDVLLDRRDAANPHYDVDLVRSLTGRFGEPIEQRLTLAEYDERDEALAHQGAVEDTLNEQGLTGLGDAGERIQKEPLLYDGRYLFVTYPPDALGSEPATAHLLRVDEHGLQSARLAEGTAEEMGRMTADWEQMALMDGLPTAVLNPLEQAREHEMQTEVKYSFDYNLFGDDSIVLEARKVWSEADGKQHRASILLDMVEGDGGREVTERFEWEVERLTILQQVNGLEHAMHEAEKLAVANGLLDGERADPRLFGDGPPDPFTTLRERELTAALDVEPMLENKVDANSVSGAAEQQDELVEPLQQPTDDGLPRSSSTEAAQTGAAWFEGQFAESEREPLLPLDDTVNYGVYLAQFEPWSLELTVEKYWRGQDGRLGIETVTLDSFDPDEERRSAADASDTLLGMYDREGLTAMMHKAELTAVENDWLDGDRADTRLFTQGPPDRFETLAQQLEGEINPYWNTDGEKIEDPAPQPGVENPYWRLDPIPVNDPEGEPLGQALHMVVYPGLERDLDAVGSPAMAADEPFRMLEMAHFETTAAVDAFGKEFNGYLVPGLLDGPELAVEVARLEGLPAEWKMLEGDDLKAYQNAELTLTRDPADWHPYNPHAERDARIAAEGLYSDPIQQVVERDEPEMASGTPELDF